MPLFLGFHKSEGSVPEERIPKGWANYKNIASKMGLKAKLVYFNAAEGVGYCLTEAPNKQSVIRAHQAIKMDLQDLQEVKLLK